MSSSSSESSSDETPRPQGRKFQDFDFFDSDNEVKPEANRANKATTNTREKYNSSVVSKEDDLHGHGIKGGTGNYVRSHDLSEKDDHGVKKLNASYTKLEVRETRTQVKKTLSSAENKQKVAIHVPHEGSFRGSESDYDSSSSVTDVSPLQSPDATPRARRKNLTSSKRSDKKPQPQTNTKFVIKESDSPENEERPRARRSNGEALSVEDLLNSSDGTPVSSGEKDMADKRRKVQRKKRNRYDEIQYRMEASSRHHRRRLLDVAAQNSMDISQLLEVVLEMEEENKARRMHTSNRGYRNSSPSPIKPIRRKNMSFSNDQVRDIDRENDRLLKRLSQLCANSQQLPARPSSASSVRSAASSIRSTASSNRSSRRPMTAMGMRSSPSQGPRMYHSATNRIRDQQRIERENPAFLKRLQSTRASTNLRRDNLLRDYHRQTGRTVEPVRPRRKQKSAYSHREENFDGRPSWQDSW